MKRTSCLPSFLIVALLAGLAVPAFAQSSVTVYGRLNETVERQTSNRSTRWVLQNNSSRLGFKGVEDLGGGLSAEFHLETGYSPDTGAANAVFWGRQSEVDLGSKQAGTVRLGRFFSEAYYATADWVSNHNHDTGTSSDAFYAYVSNDANKVAYRTPSLGGGTLEVARSFAEGPTAKPSYDAAANYVVGPAQLGAGYAKNGNARQFAARAYVSMGAVGFGGYLQRDDNAYAAGKRTNARLSAMYSIGVTELHLNYGHAFKTGTVADSAANQYTAGVNYKLSQRSKVYAFYTHVDDGSARLYGGTFGSFAVGLRHNF